MSAAIAQQARSEVAEIAKRLIGFDTTVEDPPGAQPRQEKACQEYAADQLAEAGYEIDLWEPSVDELCHHPNYIPGQSWAGRPNLVARLRGSGGGRSLLLNGHIDTVPAGDSAAWTSDPWQAEIRNGRLYGRGACDMKGGVASMIAAARAVAGGGRPPGDLLVALVTDEEVNGLGTIAMLERGYRADGAVVPEPNGLEIHVAFRGILVGELVVEGRSGHVEVEQRHFSEGGGVNAITKLRYVLDQLDRLSDDWRERPTKQHPLCSPGAINVTEISGGDFPASIPAEARTTLNICYVPGEEDESGGGGRIREELEDFVARVAAADPWLADHPPRLSWSVDYPPAEIDPAADLPTTIAGLLERRGIPARRLGLDTWDDTASLILAGVPAVSFGPGSNDQAHATDEYVELDELEAHTELLTEFALEWCGHGT